MTFYDRLELLLQQKELTKTGFMDSLGIRRATLFAWRDGSFPRGDDLVRMANALGTTAEYLITGCDTIHNDSISEEENELIARYRQLDKDKKEIISKSLDAFILADKIKKS